MRDKRNALGRSVLFGEENLDIHRSGLTEPMSGWSPNRAGCREFAGMVRYSRGRECPCPSNRAIGGAESTMEQDVSLHTSESCAIKATSAILFRNDCDLVMSGKRCANPRC